MIDNLKLQLKNHHHHHHNNSTSFENGGCSASTFSEDDHFTETSVFSEPRHTEAIEGLKELPNQNWRTKERVRVLLSRAISHALHALKEEEEASLLFFHLLY